MRTENKGQINPMGIVTLAVTIFIGVVVLGYVYVAVYSDANVASSTSMAGVRTGLNSTLSTALSGMSLLTVAIIVAAAVFILLLMGGGGQ